MRSLRLLFLGILLFTMGYSLSGCDDKKKTVVASDGNSSDETADAASSLLYIEVYSRPETSTDADTNLEGGCYITSSSSATTCNINIPESTLYYSDLIFKVGTNKAENCQRIVFRPYFYKRSASATYPIMTGVLDCSGPTPPADCYGGAAPLLISSFPTSTGQYFLTGDSIVAEYTLTSSNTRRTTSNDYSFYTNANAASNNSDKATTTTTAAGGLVHYVANTHVDYYAGCMDPWGTELYGLSLIIGDDDAEGSAIDIADDIWDWDN